MSGALPGEYRHTAWVRLARELGTQEELRVAWLRAMRRDRNKKKMLLASSLVKVKAKLIVPTRLICSPCILSSFPVFLPIPPIHAQTVKVSDSPLPPVKDSRLFLGSIWYLKSVPYRFSRRVLPSHMMNCISRLFSVSSKPTLLESCDYVRVSTQFLKWVYGLHNCRGKLDNTTPTYSESRRQKKKKKTPEVYQILKVLWILKPIS